MNVVKRFEYIIETRINGNITHAREMFEQLTLEHRGDFIQWIYDSNSEHILKHGLRVVKSHFYAAADRRRR